ncbi:stress protein [Paenibacillus swuensis]|uniref:Stress protein n=1 Tax=Paenibacillus swuensis TaxID=1178515 RepID=A0A172TE01_9BACL|nr:Dabb family protein [Paenibacillus swuensis]ANE45269.1 stress protein [Paenibacillus swuensis]
MIEHIVIFKFNEKVTSEQEQALLDQLLAFKGQIPGIAELSAGINVTEETEVAHGFSLGLRVTFETQEDLRNYGPHPLHQAFVASLSGLLEQVIVVDYPIL